MSRGQSVCVSPEQHQPLLGVMCGCVHHNIKSQFTPECKCMQRAQQFVVNLIVRTKTNPAPSILQGSKKDAVCMSFC